MNHCRTSYMVVRREKRRPSLASRMIGPLVVLLAVAVWPAAVFAADATAQSPSNAVVVFVVVLLLLGSVTAGLFFASPFRKRLSSSAADQEEVAALDAPTRRSVYSPLIPATTSPVQHAPSYPARVEHSVSTQMAPPERVSPLRLAPIQPAPVQAPPTQPLPPQARIPAPPPPVQPPPAVPVRPTGSPWSTGSPQPDSNWPPKRPGRSST